MEFHSPTTLAEALDIRAEVPGAVPILGGTDVMVELNFDRRRPPALLDLTRIRELTGWERVDGRVRLGAAVTYGRLIGELGAELPGLAMAARTVGSPQIRNRGTVGGNLGAASSAGDSHPALLAAGAEVELTSTAGIRLVPIGSFFTGVKAHVGRPDELITAVWIRPTRGADQFSKIGTRNAMVIAVAAVALSLDPLERRVGTGLGSLGPTPRSAARAEAFLTTELDWEQRRPPSASVIDEFARLVVGVTSPIDDVRSSAAYRRHAVTVLARRCLTWAWRDLTTAKGA